MICANILIYYLLVTCCCCCCGLVSSAASSSAASSSASTSASSIGGGNNQQAEQQQKQYLSNEEERKATAANHQHVHKLMSEKDLRRTFQVDSHDQVPEYEVLKLQVNEDGSHLISPISDLSELLAQPKHQEFARHKRDTSESGANDGRTSNFEQQQQQQNENINNHKQSNINNNKLIVIDLSTFGKDFKLRLKRNADFQQRIKDMKMFMAESTQDGQLKYTEVSHPSSPSAGKHKQVSNFCPKPGVGQLIISQSGDGDDDDTLL